MTIVLFEHPDSPNCHKVRLLLNALDLPHDRRRVDLLGGETRSAAFLAVNGRGQIPVLVDGESTLPESNAILVYLADRFAPELAGSGAAARAQVLRWLFWQASGPSARIASVGFQRQIRPARGEAPDEERVRSEMSAWGREAEVLERHLRTSDWLAGQRWTVADVAAGAWVEIAADVGMLAEMPATAAWVRRLRGLDFWARTDGYELLRRR